MAGQLRTPNAVMPECLSAQSVNAAVFQDAHDAGLVLQQLLHDAVCFSLMTGWMWLTSLVVEYLSTVVVEVRVLDIYKFSLLCALRLAPHLKV